MERLEILELCYEERLAIASQLRQTLGRGNAHAPPEKTKTMAQVLWVLTIPLPLHKI
jgi:hypothetical protein